MKKKDLSAVEIIEKYSKELEMKDFIKENNIGCAVLESGFIIKIRNNFFMIKKLWETFIKIKNSGTDEEFDEFFKNTDGGLIYTEESIFQISQIKMLLSPLIYSNLNEEEKLELEEKNAKLNKFILKMLGNESDEDDDQGDF